AESTFIPLGYDPDRWPDSNDHKDNSNSTHIELVCVSQLTFQFDILPLVKAIKGNDRFRLTIIGEDGLGERYSEVKEFTNTNKMENIVFLGKINREEMANHLAKMDIGVVPMISTSIPNKTFDYIASYLPILSLGNNDVSNFVTENNIGWTSSFDHIDIKKTLQEISSQNIQLKQNSVAKIRPYLSRECLHLKIANTIFS
ncbi:MAG: glycosyltransferase, partial [Deltaproteobacteria bacterium]|nr:glycosyltransferase [Deltaproteobacteria bacterium]